MRPSEPDRLIELLKPPAITACSNAHAPYSRFPVGAALLEEGGKVFIGCNVENASYGLTVCAERNALAHAIANGVSPGGISALLIYTPGDKVHAPCGACRQAMHELLSPEARVISCCDGEESKDWRLEQLLPDPFEF
jgi:cytidine deaminase